MRVTLYGVLKIRLWESFFRDTLSLVLLSQF